MAATAWDVTTGTGGNNTAACGIQIVVTTSAANIWASAYYDCSESIPAPETQKAPPPHGWDYHRRFHPVGKPPRVLGELREGWHLRPRQMRAVRCAGRR